MKKIVSIMLVLALACIALGAALADHGTSRFIEVNGYIGGDADIDINDYTAELTYPSPLHWHVSNSTANASGTYDVESGLYTISHNAYKPVNNDIWEVAVFEITLAEFNLNDPDGLNTGLLTLNLKGDLLDGEIGRNLQNGYDGDEPYSTLLDYKDVWTFGFDGEYRGSLPLTAIEPVYEMVLDFSLQRTYLVPADPIP